MKDSLWKILEKDDEAEEYFLGSHVRWGKSFGKGPNVWGTGRSHCSWWGVFWERRKGKIQELDNFPAQERLFTKDA